LYNNSLLENNFVIDNQGGGIMNNGPSGILNNNAYLWNSSGSSLINAGTLYVAPGAYIGGSVYSGGFGSFTQNAGKTRNEGLITQGTVNIDGGTISGNGTWESLYAPMTVAAGATVDPGSSIGTLSVIGDFWCNGCSTIIEIADLTDFDKLVISGGASLTNGHIQFDFLGFAPSAGDTFDFFTADSGINLTNMTFDFTGLLPGFNFDVILGSQTLTFTALNDGGLQPIPLPASGWLFGSGMLGLSLFGRLNGRLRRQSAI
jgi:hypothetical protein